MKRHQFFILYFLMISGLSFAQFDKKITFNAFAGTTLPIGDRVNADQVPYVFSNFRNGLQAGIGGQYNFSPKFSVGLNLTALVALNYSNPILTTGNRQEIIEKEQSNYKNSILNNYSLGIALKYKLLRQARFNPYVFGEININYYSAEIAPRLQYYEAPASASDSVSISDKYTILRFNAKKIEPSLALGGNAGVGVDIKLNDTFTLMLQSAYYLIGTANAKDLGVNLSYIGFQGGLRFSILRSKSIL